MTLQIAALTSGVNVPSSRFRIRQYIQPLREAGVQVQEFVPRVSKYGLFGYNPQGLYRWLTMPLYVGWQCVKLGSRTPGLLGSWRNQVTWLEREILPGIFSLEGLLKKPLVLDVDDAIWLTFPFSPGLIRKIAQQATIVVVGNVFLADWFSKYARDVRVVPTAVDTDRFSPENNPDQKDRFVVGWSGGSWNLPYLYDIEIPLAHFLSRHPEARLMVVCDQYPKFKKLSPEQINFIPWSSETEVKAIKSLNVGLMPLPVTDWARGKCSFKMLQYMACGVPVVVSPVGMNESVLRMGDVGFAARTAQEWSSAIEVFYLDREYASQCGLNGRRVVKANFSRNQIAAQLAGIFRTFVVDPGGLS